MRLRSGNTYAPPPHPYDTPPLPGAAVSTTRHAIQSALDVWCEAAPTSENRREAAYRIWDAWRAQGANGAPDQALHLNALGLTTLPDVLGELTRLEQLFIDDNQLTALPESIGGLQSLSCLNATNNRLTALPECLGLLPQLATLEVAENQLASLPQSLEGMTQLSSLNVSHNPLTHLPSLARLHALAFLDASHTELTALPESIGQARALENLIASHNAIHTLPDALCDLDQLEELDLEANELSSLPARLSALSQLGILVLSGNRFETIPESIRTLRHCEVWLEDNPLPAAEVTRFLSQPTDAVVIFDRGENRADRVAIPLAGSIAEWRAHLPDLAHAAWHDSDHPHASHFGGWLAQLQDTPEFHNPSLRGALIERVRHVLAYLDDNPDIRETLFHVAHEASASCIDNVALGLNTVEMAIQTHQAERGVLIEPALFALGRGQFRMAALSRIAQQHVAEQEAAGMGPDPVEVHLAFQVHLRERLSLPVRTQAMQFFRLSMISAGQLDRAARDIEAADNEPAATFAARYDDTLARLTSATPPLLDPSEPRHQLARYLACDYTPWRDHVARQQPDPPHRDALFAYLEWLSDQHSAGHLNEKQFLDANNAAAFYANHGPAYRAALAQLITAHDAPAEPIQPAAKRRRINSPTTTAKS